jgi:Mg2+-importing ATPase
MVGTSGSRSPSNLWARPVAEVLAALHTSERGLSSREAAERLERFGRNAIGRDRGGAPWPILLTQFRNPLVLILVFAAVVSLWAREWADASIVLAVILGSAFLGFWYEYRASSAVEELRARVRTRSTVLRDGTAVALPAEDLVPGDVVLLSAGSLIAADGLVLAAKDFFVSQSVLTGETFPSGKTPYPVPEQASLADRTNCVFMGTSV